MWLITNKLNHDVQIPTLQYKGRGDLVFDHNVKAGRSISVEHEWELKHPYLVRMEKAGTVTVTEVVEEPEPKMKSPNKEEKNQAPQKGKGTKKESNKKSEAQDS
jgi:hypothetical protein